MEAALEASTVDAVQQPSEKTTEEKQVSDLTVAELKKLIQATVEEMLEPLWEYLFTLEDSMPDPDAGKTLKPEFEAELRQLAADKTAGKPRRLLTETELLQELGEDE